MTDAGKTRSSAALAAVRQRTSLPAVVVHLDGQRLIAAFQLDAHEHDRRSGLGIGAVTSRPVLHGLWLLPAGIPVPADALPAVKRRRLRAAPHFAVEGEAGFARLYSPPGVVRTIAFTGPDPTLCVLRAVRFTPIVERIVVSHRAMPLPVDARRLSDRFGIGVIEVSGDEICVVAEPERAVVGVPAVYRWWIAELAYESWLQQSAQPVS